MNTKTDVAETETRQETYVKFIINSLPKERSSAFQRRAKKFIMDVERYHADASAFVRDSLESEGIEYAESDVRMLDTLTERFVDDLDEPYRSELAEFSNFGVLSAMQIIVGQIV